MQQYLDYLHSILKQGRYKGDRTGTGTQSLFGAQMRFDLAKGFPLLTTKKVFFKGIALELLWFLQGSTNVKWLQEQGVHIWDEWADENGELGPVYGSQWRNWRGAGEPYTDSDTLSVTEKVDQIATVIESLKKNPDSRRHIVTAWNPAEVDNMALPPCHALFQFYSDELTLEERIVYRAATRATIERGESVLLGESDDRIHSLMDSLKVPRRRLSCQLYQRSADSFLGVPFNIASYALLTHMVAQQVDMVPGDFIWTGGDCHIYSNHTEQVGIQLSRDTRSLPTLKINRKPESIFDYKYEDFEIVGYDPHPSIKAPIAV